MRFAKVSLWVDIGARTVETEAAGANADGAAFAGIAENPPASVAIIIPAEMVLIGEGANFMKSLVLSFKSINTKSYCPLIIHFAVHD